jgi:hypothetical protein
MTSIRSSENFAINFCWMSEGLKEPVNRLWISRLQIGTSARQNPPRRSAQSLRSHAFTNSTQENRALIKKVMHKVML